MIPARSRRERTGAAQSRPHRLPGVAIVRPTGGARQLAALPAGKTSLRTPSDSEFLQGVTPPSHGNETQPGSSCARRSDGSKSNRRRNVASKQSGESMNSNEADHGRSHQANEKSGRESSSQQSHGGSHGDSHSGSQQESGGSQRSGSSDGAGRKGAQPSKGGSSQGGSSHGGSSHGGSSHGGSSQGGTSK
jgi:hypothetical protein